MKIFDMAQGSDEWTEIRRGIPTGSEFSRIITPAKGEYAAGADAYAAELLAEFLDWSKKFSGNADTDRGNLMEPEALKWLAMRHDLEGRAVGFCLSDCGRYGASPDWLLNDGRPVEVKNPDTHTFLKWKIKGELPQEHKVQVHGEMVVTGAESGIFLAYLDHPVIEPLLIEVVRDVFTAKVKSCVEQFCDRLEELKIQLAGSDADTVFARPILP